MDVQEHISTLTDIAIDYKNAQDKELARLDSLLAEATDDGELEALRAQRKGCLEVRQRLIVQIEKSQLSNKLTPAASSIPDQRLLTRLTAAWAIDYKDPSLNTLRLHAHLKLCYDQWKSQELGFFSPYFAVFQSSGHGKSRLVQELCTSQKIPHMYICFRPVGSTGYPPRTAALAAFLTEDPSEAKWDAVLRAVLGLFCEVTNAESNSAISFDMWEAYKKEQGTAVENDIHRRATGLVNQTGIVPVDFLDPSQFLFVLDEARELVTATDLSTRSSFRMMRSSLRNYTKGVFAILMDTLSNIANFTPTVENDPSLRDAPDRKLFPPFHLVVNIDTFSKPPATLTAADIEEELSVSHLVTKGRILWSSTVLGIKRATLSLELNASTSDEQLLAETKPDEWRKVVTLAAMKLVGGRRDWSVDSLSRVACLSVLSARAQVSIAPTSDSASVSVGSHLATCVNISENRDAVFSMYPSEPAVAAGAFEVVWDDEKWRNNYVQLLSHLRTSMLEGIVDAGQCGELVARLLLNLAWDLSVQCLDKFYSMITLEGFLNILIGPDRLAEAKTVLVDQSILNAQLCFTHFIPISYVPNEQDLAKLMSRGAAAICQRNQVGVDLMIPLLLEDGAISVFLISVKNHASQFDSSWPSSAGSRVSLRTVCPELSNVRRYFTLLMQLGAPESMVFAGQLRKHSALAVFGLSTFCPSVGDAKQLVYQHLQAILGARSGIEGIGFDEASARVVRGLVPLQWTASAGPRLVEPISADAASSTSTAPPPNDAQPLTKRTFYLVDAVSRTSWALDAYTDTTTNEVAALFQQQGLAATILRGNGSTMKRVLQPVVLEKCIVKVGAGRKQVTVVFLTIDADDMGLVCTFPVRTVGDNVAVLHRLLNRPRAALSGSVQNYLKNRVKKTQRKRKSDEITNVTVEGEQLSVPGPQKEKRKGNQSSNKTRMEEFVPESQDENNNNKAIQSEQRGRDKCRSRRSTKSTERD